MTAYGNIDHAVSGLPYGLITDIISRTAAETITFGQPVFGYKDDSTKAYGYKKDTAKIVLSTALIASNSVIVTVDGAATTATVFATDHATTMAAIIAKLNALTGVEAILDNADATNLTLIIRKRGIASFVASFAVTLGASQPTDTVSYGTGQVYLGISTFTQKVGGNYVAGDLVNIARQGQVMAACASGAKAQGPVYLTAAGLPTSAESGNQAVDGSFFATNESENPGFAVIVIDHSPVIMPFGDKF